MYRQSPVGTTERPIHADPETAPRARCVAAVAPLLCVVMAIRRAFLTMVAMTALSAGRVATGADAVPPVQVSVSVEPATLAAGSDARVTLKLVPNTGIKLNKYPKIKIVVPAAAGLVAESEASIGNAAPPSADDLEANYYHGSVDPLSVSVHVDPAATRGRHDVPAKLSYFYCVASSGYCAPAKVAVTIPVTVR